MTSRGKEAAAWREEVAASHGEEATTLRGGVAESQGDNMAIASRGENPATVRGSGMGGGIEWEEAQGVGDEKGRARQ